MVATGRAINLGSIPIWKSASGKTWLPGIAAIGYARIHDLHKRERRRRKDEEALALLL